MKRAVDIGGAVRWYEGMLLAPHHMQQASSRAEHLVHYHAMARAPFGWGVVALEVDPEALREGLFRVEYVEAIYEESGLVVAGSPEDARLGSVPPPEGGDRLTVWLCVPEVGPDRREVEPRFEAFVDRQVRDLDPDAGAGQLALTLDRLRPRLSLKIRPEDTKGFESMPIARLRYDGEYRLDEDYVPPMLKLARPAPGRGSSPAHRWYEPLRTLCEEVRDLVDNTAMRLADRLRSPMSSENRLVFERQFQALATALPPFDAQFDSGEVHPFVLYTALAGLAGHAAAATISRDKPLPDVPRYRHDDAMAAFRSLSGQVAQSLQGTVESEFDPHRMQRTEQPHRFRLPLEAGWTEREIVLGFTGPTTEVLRWAEDCYIGSESVTEAMTSHRDRGATRRRRDWVEGLSRPRDTELFAIKVDDRYIRDGEVIYVFNPAKDEHETAPSEITLFVHREGTET